MELRSGKSLDTHLMKSLPTEILQKIFSYLPIPDRVRVERVCRRWKNVSTERVWRDVQVLHTLAPGINGFSSRFGDNSKKFDKLIKMEDNEVYIDYRKLEVIHSVVSRAGTHIKEFIFGVPYINTGPTQPAEVLSIINAHCHNMESIQLWKIENSDIGLFSKLLRNNKQLHSIACCHAYNIIKVLPLGDWKSLCIAGLVNSREELSLTQEKKLERKLIALIRNSPLLERFYVSYWTPNIPEIISKFSQVTNLSFSHWDGIVANKLTMNTSLLNRLTYLMVDFPEDWNEDYRLINLLSHCINLERLGLFYWEYDLPLAVERTIMALPKLESLHLDATSVTDEILSRLLKFKCLVIESSNVSITGNGILKMIANSECLKELKIPQNNATTEFFKKLVQNVEKRPNILRISVDPEIYEEARKICKGSGIHVISKLEDFVSGFANWS